MGAEQEPSLARRARSGAREFFHILFVLAASTVAGALAVGVFAGLHELTSPGRAPDSELVWLIPAMSLEGIGIFFAAAITTGLKLGLRHLASEERSTAFARLRKIRLRFIAASGAVIVVGSLLALHGGHWRRATQWLWLVIGLLTIGYAVAAWLKDRERSASPPPQDGTGG